MNDTTFSSTHHDSNTSTSRPPLRRKTGPIGGVAAGLATTLGVPAVGMRIALAAAAMFSGGAVLLAYIVAWMLMPVDESLLESEKPASAPPVLLAIVAAGITIQIIFGLVSNLPLGWLALAAVALWLYLRRD